MVMVKRTEVKVDTSTPEAKRKLIKAIADLQGIDKIEVDSEKSTLAVTGIADLVDVVTCARKTAKRADIVSVGPPPNPQGKKDGDKQPEEKQNGDKKPEEKQNGDKKPEEKKPPPNWLHVPVAYHQHQQQPVVVVDEYCQTACSIM